MPRAWLLPDYQGHQSLELREVPFEQPGRGEVRLKVEAFALNWGDMDLMWDRYSFSFPSMPARVGIEAAGIVDAVGEGVTDIKVGDRVGTLPYFYYNRGASTESLVIDQRYVTKTPSNLTPAEATSIWMQYMTAYFPLDYVRKVGAGSTVLVTAGTSTAGAASLQIGRILGATMIGTTRFEKNADYLRQMGADHVIIDTPETDIAAEIKRVTGGRGIDLAFDPVGASMIPRYTKALARDAWIFFYGTLDEKFPAALPLIDMFQKNAVFHPYSLFNYVENADACAQGKAFVYDMLEQGRLKPSVDRVYPMEEIKQAFDYLSKPRDKHGKVVIATGL
ncbi:MAG: zinc-dependent alcohol dehydrogenase family protein [Rhizobiaceae bacterium]